MIGRLSRRLIAISVALASEMAGLSSTSCTRISFGMVNLDYNGRVEVSDCSRAYRYLSKNQANSHF
jgi:hypothetical protein